MANVIKISAEAIWILVLAILVLTLVFVEPWRIWALVGIGIWIVLTWLMRNVI